MILTHLNPGLFSPFVLQIPIKDKPKDPIKGQKTYHKRKTQKIPMRDKCKDSIDGQNKRSQVGTNQEGTERSYERTNQQISCRDKPKYLIDLSDPVYNSAVHL